jgi:tRNA pseudouridine55 synthase
LAAALGTVTVMSALVRTAIGEFRVENAVAPEQLTGVTLAEHLMPPLTAVANLPRLTLSDAETIEIRHGRAISARTENGADCNQVEIVAIDKTGQLASILHLKKPGEWWPQNNF